MEKRVFNRRDAMRQGIGGLAIGVGAPIAPRDGANPALKGRIRQSVARWCYGQIKLETLCASAKEMGLIGIDLLTESEWPIAKSNGLLCTMAYGIGTIPSGWNHPENHDRLVAEAERMIPKVAAAGLPNIITFSGNRAGIDGAQGLKNCVDGLKRIVKIAEVNRVTVCLELLNSKRDHKDYQCDHTSWGVELCRAVGSERIKLLYDIYHMQIMEGDVIASVRGNIEYIAHFHTGGVPGRHEIDETQELNYNAVCRAIAGTGFKGVVAHEFIPSRDAMTSLRQAVQICDV